MKLPQTLLNQQDQIADRFLIADQWLQETSKIALFKIQSLQKAKLLPVQSLRHLNELEALIDDAFFSFVPPAHVLSEEGFFFSEQSN
jgi:hypothetical protein